MNDAIAIALKRGANIVFRFGTEAAARVRALRGLRREDVALAGLQLLA